MIITIMMILLTVISVPLGAEAFNSGPDLNAVDEFLQETVALYRIPGLSIAIVNEEEVLYTFSSGQASSAAEVGPDTPFLLGSTSKMFTALAVMQLVEQGKIELDAPVQKYLPEFQLARPEYQDQITVRHLLHHTSGLSQKGMPGTTFGEDNLEQELVSLRQCIPDTPPGERYLYFNPNYRLLGLIIERVSNKQYGEFLNEEIFRPLAMTSTFAGPEGVKGLARGHGQLFGYPLPRKQVFRPGALPSGYLVSSASDIARFLMAELRAGGGQPGLLNPETVKATWTPPDGKNEGYAMGWLVANDSADERVLLHGGALENYQSFFCLIPQRKIGFAFLLNQGGLLPMLSFNAVRDGLLQIINGEQAITQSVRWPVIIVSAIFLFFLGIELWRTLRLKSWLLRTARHKPWRRRFNILFELVGPTFLLFGLHPLMNRIMGDQMDWSMLYSLLPELFFILVIAIGLGFIRGFSKIWLLKGKLPRNVQDSA